MKRKDKRHGNPKPAMSLPGTPEEAAETRALLSGIMRQSALAGTYSDNPELEARLLRGFDSLVETAIIAADLRNGVSQRLLALCEINRFTRVMPRLPEKNLASEDKEIIVKIASWAAGAVETETRVSRLIDTPRHFEAPPQGSPTPEARTVMPIEVTSDDELEARRRRPPSEPLLRHLAPCVCDECFAGRLRSAREADHRIIVDKDE